MLRIMRALFGLLAVAMGTSPVQAQAPSITTLTLSLKTMNKALAACRISYTRVRRGSDHPLLESIVGAEDYGKDLKSLRRAESYTNALVAHPEKISGRLLVAIISTTDDFSIGVGSTRAELLKHLVINRSANPNELVVAAEDLNNCQNSLFDAGDDFVELVLDYVGAEDGRASR